MRKLLAVILIIAALILGVAVVFRGGNKVATPIMETSNMAKADKIIKALQ